MSGLDDVARIQLVDGSIRIGASSLSIVSGALSGSRAVFSSGVEAVRFSGILFDASGIVVHGTVSGFRGIFASGVEATVYSGIQMDVSGIIANGPISGKSVDLGGAGSGVTVWRIVSGTAEFATKGIDVSLSGVQSRFIAFDFAQSNVTYGIIATVGQSGFYHFISGKTVSGFSIGLNTTGIATPTTFDWMLYR